jgi:hypothetical protein
MSSKGPGQFGGSRATVRKRAQRKRAAAQGNPVRKQEEEATIPKKPVKEAGETKMESMAYELVAIATQLRKAANARSEGFDKDHPVIEDADRAKKILFGMLKDNEAKNAASSE